MAKVNSSKDGKIILAVELNTKTMKAQTKEMISGFSDVESAVSKTNKQLAKLNDPGKKNGLLDLLKQIAIATRENGRISERILAAERKGNLDVIAAIGAKSKAQQNAAKVSNQISVIEAQQKSKLAQIEAKRLAQMELIDKKAQQHHKKRTQELTEQDKAINALKGSSNGLLSHFEKGIIVANQFAELMRKMQQFAQLMMKPVMEAGQFEQWQVALKNLTGSTEVADQRFREMIQFAKVTPFTIPGIVETGNRLQALGRYSLNTIRMLGDLAAASGKDVEQAVEAYSNLVTGRTGIAVKQFRALLISTADWTRTTGKAVLQNMKGVKATTEEMLTGLEKIIKGKNFTGLMEAQSKTFLGKLTNLEDSIQTFLARVGENFLSSSKDIVSGLTDIFNSFTLHAQDIGAGVKFGGFTLLVGAAVTLFGIILKSGAMVLAFFANLRTATLGIGLAALPLTKLAALLIAISAIAGASAYLIATTKKTNAELLEESIQLEGQTDALLKSTEATIASSRSTIKLIDTYNKLKKEGKENTQVTNDLKRAVFQLSSQYEIFGNFGEKLIGVTKKLTEQEEEATKKAKELRDTLNKIRLDTVRLEFKKTADTIRTEMDSATANVIANIKRIMAAENLKGTGFRWMANAAPNWITTLLAGTGLKDLKDVEKYFSALEGIKPGPKSRSTAQDLLMKGTNVIESFKFKGKDGKFFALPDDTKTELKIALKKLFDGKILELNSLFNSATVTTIEEAKNKEFADYKLSLEAKGLSKSEVDKKMLEKYEIFYEELRSRSAEAGTKGFGKIKLQTQKNQMLTTYKKGTESEIEVDEASFNALETSFSAKMNNLSDQVDAAENALKTASEKEEQAMRKYFTKRKVFLDAIIAEKELLINTWEGTSGVGVEKRESNKAAAFLNASRKLIAESEIIRLGKYGKTPQGKEEVTSLLAKAKDFDNEANKLISEIFGETVERMNAAGKSLDDILKYINDEYQAIGGDKFDIMGATPDLKKKFFEILSKKTEFDKLFKSIIEGKTELDIQKLDFTTPEGIKNAKSLITTTLGSGKSGLAGAGMLSDILQSSVGASFAERSSTAQGIENDAQRRIALKNIEVDKQKLISELLQYLLDAIKSTPMTEGLTTTEKVEMGLTTDKNVSKITEDINKAKKAGGTAEQQGIRDTKEADFKAWQDRLSFANQALGQLTDAYNMFYDNARQKISEEVEAWKKAALEKMDIEQKRAYQYARTQKQRERIDEVYAKKKEDIEKEASKKKAEQMKVWFAWDKAIKIAQTTMNTAMAIMGIWANVATLGPVGAAIMSGVVGALGIAQVAAIAAQEMPEGGFEVGGYTGAGNNKQKAGTVHKNEFVLNAKATKKNRPLLEAMNDGDFSVADMLARGRNDLLGVTAPLSVRRDFLIVNELKKSDSNLIAELRDLKKVFIEYAGTPVVIGDDAARQITGLGIKKIRKFSML